MGQKTIGVVGCGVVGEAVARTFENLGHEVRRYDPAKGLFNDPTSEVLFICIYTDDMEKLERVVQRHLNHSLVLVIKSTLRPGTTEKLIQKYGDKIAFVPEFLTEATAQEDCECPDKVVIGTHHPMVAEILKELHEPLDAPIVVMSPTEAEMLKLAVNSFYAVKVVFANEIYDLCSELGANYNNVQKGMEIDKHISPNHLKVWHKGYRGFGGKCLPKDSQMLLEAFLHNGIIPEVLSSAIRSNNHLQRHAIDTEGD